MKQRNLAVISWKMNCTPKNKSDDNANDEITNAEHHSETENSPGEVWQRDIEKHDYYYDDSHGYEIYNPEEDEETDED